jgi:ABC-type antimicrobial peptide transport system permease subunit
MVIIMVKKRFLSILIGIFVILLCLLLGVLYYRYLLKKPYLNGLENIDQITITMLPVPPKTKMLLSKEDIEKFTDIIYDYSYQPVMPNTGKGWGIKIDIAGSPDYTIIFTGDLMECNGTWYSTEESIQEDIRKLFESLK